MKPAKTSASKTKVVFTWLAVLIALGLMYSFSAWWFSRGTPVATEDTESNIVYLIVMVAFGMFFLVAGVTGYAVVILTNCFTFNFNRSVWNEIKVKLYFANIFVPLGVGLGLGLIVTPFIRPALLNAGINPELAGLAPVLGILFLFQIVQLWFLIWGPVEKRIIIKRVAALGITPQQLQGAFLVGLSNPGKSSFKKFGLVEEDMGALWVGPEQLIYWGDIEQLAFSREQVIEVERKTDSGSTSMLGGVAHVILHIKQPDGSIRQIRLHNEGLLTMGQKRVAMEQLAEAISRWHEKAVSIPEGLPVT